MHEVVKKFAYAPDIYKNVNFKKGDKVTLVAGVIDGLISEGFIKPASIETKTVTLETAKPVLRQPVPQPAQQPK